MLSLEKQAEHLQKVSRTFALTIPALPNPVDKYVSLSYLLCRTCDTIEDDPKMTHELRVKELHNYAKAVRKEIDHIKWTDTIYEELKDTSVPCEVELLKELPDVLERLYSYPKPVISIITKCIDIMSDGMAYQQMNDVIAAQSDLDRYCYSVAGVVGELLAELFMYHSPVLTKQKDQFLSLAVCLGEGLQMTNIIKDIWEDAERGVSWLPLGLKNDPDNSAEMQNYYSSMPKDKKIELLNDQIKIACGHLRNGVRFTTMIPLREQGIRRFCSWCIAMAFLSLKKVYDNPLFTDSSQSKISREQVKSVVRWSSICAYSNFTLNRYFDHISKGLPFVDIDQCELYARVSKWSNF